MVQAAEIAIVGDALLAIAVKLAPNGKRMTGLTRLTGGASQETWAFEVEGDAGTSPLILRRAPGGTYQHETAAGLETEAAVIAALAARDVPVPPVRYVLEPGDGLGRGFVTARVPGETIARRILRDDVFAAVRPDLPAQFGRILSTIHATPPRRLPALRSIGIADSLEVLTGALALCAPNPVFELALVWLYDHQPEEVTPALVHGDFRNGNLIIDATGVRAVLDWELVHLGDPMEDLGWLCTTPWRFGAVDAPVGGLGQREALFAGYEAVSGVAVDAGRVRWWEMAGSLRWGINCASMVALFRDGTDPSVERAMIARRTSENAIDLLRMLSCGD